MKNRQSVSDAYDDAALILGLAVSGDHEIVSDVLDDLIIWKGVSGTFEVAVCLAATMIGDAARPGGAALDYPGIDAASYDTRWVARFVSAYVNADRPMGEALFGAAVADGQLPACMATLTGSTIATLRSRHA